MEMLPGPYIRVYVWRTTLVWVALHAFSRSLNFSFRAFMLALAFTIAVLLLDAERRSERRFLANLGFSRAGIVAAILLTGSALEIVLRLVTRGLANG
jgi:hypothetical protein